MTSQNRKIFFIGNSHCHKIYNGAINAQAFANYELINLARPGATIDFLNLLSFNLPEFSKNDFVIIQTLGNDMFVKDFYKEKRGTHFKFHLRSYQEVSDTVWKNVLKQFLEFLNLLTNPTVLVIDSPYRFVTSCCKLHKIPTRSKAYQDQRNKTVKNLILKEAKDNVFYLDHRRFLGVSKHKAHSTRFYKTLLSDNVHLPSDIYRKIAVRLSNTVDKIANN